MIKVTTKTVCDNCGVEHFRDGAEGAFPPEFWFCLDLSQRLKGVGWSRHKKINVILCCMCAKTVATVINKWEEFT